MNFWGAPQVAFWELLGRHWVAFAALWVAFGRPFGCVWVKSVERIDTATDAEGMMKNDAIILNISFDINEKVVSFFDHVRTGRNA